MKQIRWFDRKFEFAFEQNIFPSIIERLAGTPLRLRAKMADIPAEKHRVKWEGSWSMLENIGHLFDLEPLWSGRLQDILDGKVELREADLENKATDQANFNNRTADQLIADFTRAREQLLEKLESLSEAEVYQHALHPRLKTPMRTMDLFLFVAEHDDHHLARISELSRLIH